jgi:hypothetical protein
LPFTSPDAVIPVCEAGSSQRYVKGIVPPEMVDVALPSLPALQLTLVLVAILAASPAGSVIVTLVEATQLFASVTVTAHVPAESPEAVAVVCAGAGSFHRYV